MVQQHNRHFLADCPMGTFFVVVRTPILHLFLRVCKVQEPMSVEAFGAEAPVEGLNKCVVGRFPAWRSQA